VGCWFCGEGATEETSIVRRTEDASDNHSVEREVSKADKTRTPLGGGPGDQSLARDVSRDLGSRDWRFRFCNDFRSCLRLSNTLYNFACLNFSRCPFLLLPLISQPKTTMLSFILPSCRERAPLPSSRITRSFTASTSSHVFPKQASKYVKPPHLPRVDALNPYCFDRS